MMGIVIGIGSIIYIAVTVALSVGYVSPAASLANAWDTRMGGALADAISCNAVVKGFGAEDREEDRLGLVVGKWRDRTARTWRRGTLNGSVQGTMLVLLRTAIVGIAIWLWSQGLAKAGDITLVLTSFFVLQGYLRDIGQHVRNLQRSVNDMEELVEVQYQPLGIEDRPGAKPVEIEQGAVVFDHVGFQYGNHTVPLYRDFSVSIPAGQRVGLVGHSGSGKTTFVKLIQRLYDVTGGRILIDGHDIRDITQASLRGQIAIVAQEPILFHRSLAENIAYARPGATRQEIIEAAKLASAHDFIVTLPKGYETMVGERGVKLSGGERQRVAIARAFLADCADPDPRRSHLEPRFGIRTADPEGDGTADGRTHHARHRAPAVDGAGARSPAGLRQGPDHRGRHPCRTRHPRRRRLPPSVRAPGAGTHQGPRRRRLGSGVERQSVARLAPRPLIFLEDAGIVRRFI